MTSDPATAATISVAAISSASGVTNVPAGIRAASSATAVIRGTETVPNTARLNSACPAR